MSAKPEIRESLRKEGEWPFKFDLSPSSRDRRAAALCALRPSICTNLNCRNGSKSKLRPETRGQRPGADTAIGVRTEHDRPAHDPVLNRLHATPGEVYGGRLERFVLYRSRARGKAQPRDRRHGRGDDDGEGRPPPACHEPHDVRARLPSQISRSAIPTQALRQPSRTIVIQGGRSRLKHGGTCSRDMCEPFR